MIVNKIQQNILALSNQVGAVLKGIPSNLVQPKEKLVLIARVSEDGLINDDETPPKFFACFSVDARFDGPPKAVSINLLNTYTDERNVPKEEHPILFTQAVRSMQRFYNSES